MRRLASDHESRARMGRAGRVRVREVYTWDGSLSRLLNLIGEGTSAAARPSEHHTLRDVACGS
jgi:glycosyltransferase involved in cell wall biosynthesis